MYSCEWSEWVKHSPVIAKWKCGWTKRAFLLQKKHVNEEEISEAFVRERRKVNGGRPGLKMFAPNPAENRAKMGNLALCYGCFRPKQGHWLSLLREWASWKLRWEQFVRPVSLSRSFHSSRSAEKELFWSGGWVQKLHLVSVAFVIPRSTGKKKPYTALLQCRTFLCRKKMGSTEERFWWWIWFPWFLQGFCIHHRPGMFFFEAKRVLQKIFFRWWLCTPFFFSEILEISVPWLPETHQLIEWGAASWISETIRCLLTP